MPYLVLGVLALALIATPAQGASGKAALRVVKTLPMTIRGTDFRAGESVRVTVVMGSKRFVQQTAAGTTGAFSVHWNRVRLNWCAMPLTIEARGSRTGKVAAKIPIAQCPPS
jgi:hypothetical protein